MSPYPWEYMDILVSPHFTLLLFVAVNEKNSPLCHQHGNLICGQCVCEATRGGDRCECPLASYGVKNALELEDRCRE
ncbi:unnamed protein product [Strongylus vulgaris]|uniref:Integrin beta epidermal growth factor-like domain-containing protein n=1 Tax=Strongylus vulgaris TaxID=40348 RepID=A0A3P7JJP3_STRVU|nr:unnamed protein product [Strongylus vulgaris]